MEWDLLYNALSLLARAGAASAQAGQINGWLHSCGPAGATAHQTGWLVRSHDPNSPGQTGPPETATDQIFKEITGHPVFLPEVSWFR